jgi:hypothetical protein
MALAEKRPSKGHSCCSPVCDHEECDEHPFISVPESRKHNFARRRNVLRQLGCTEQYIEDACTIFEGKTRMKQLRFCKHHLMNEDSYHPRSNGFLEIKSPRQDESFIETKVARPILIQKRSRADDSSVASSSTAADTSSSDVQPMFPAHEVVSSMKRFKRAEDRSSKRDQAYVQDAKNAIPTSPDELMKEIKRLKKM